MPVKTGLELITPIGSNRVDAAREFFDHIIHELDRTPLQAVEKVDGRGESNKEVQF